MNRPSASHDLSMSLPPRTSSRTTPDCMPTSPASPTPGRYDLGDLHDFTYVWNEELTNWKPIKDVPGLLPRGGGAGFMANYGACHGCTTAHC